MRQISSSEHSDYIFLPSDRSVVTIFAIKFVGASPRLVVATLFPLLMAALAAGPSAAGTLMLGNTLSAIISNIIYSKLVVRFGVKRLLLFGGIFSAFGLASLAFSSTFVVAFFGFGFIGGFGWGVFGLRTPQELVNSLSGSSWAKHTRASLSAPLVAAIFVPTAILYSQSYIDWKYIVLVVAGLIVLVSVYAAHTYRAYLPAAIETPRQILRGRSRVTDCLIVSTCISGYITGTLNTHLIIIATMQEGRTTSQVVSWSIGFALISIFSVYIWPVIRLRLLTITGTGFCASVLTFYAVGKPNSDLALISLLLWAAFSSGHYIDALKRVTMLPKSMITIWNGKVLLLHMITGGIGAFFSGYLAEQIGSYSPVYWVLVILFLVSLLFLLGSSPNLIFRNHKRDVK